MNPRPDDARRSHELGRSPGVRVVGWIDVGITPQLEAHPDAEVRPFRGFRCSAQPGYRQPTPGCAERRAVERGVRRVPARSADCPGTGPPVFTSGGGQAKTSAMRAKEIVGSMVAVPPDLWAILSGCDEPALGGELRRQPKDRPPRARTTLPGPLSSPGRVAVAAGGKERATAQSKVVLPHLVGPVATNEAPPISHDPNSPTRADPFRSDATAIYFARCG
jgi:hypothetical protein